MLLWELRENVKNIKKQNKVFIVWGENLKLRKGNFRKKQCPVHLTCTDKPQNIYEGVITNALQNCSKELCTLLVQQVIPSQVFLRISVCCSCMMNLETASITIYEPPSL